MFISTVYASNIEVKGSDQPVWLNFIPWIMIFMVFYFFLLRPQEKKRREQQDLINSVKVGESVITTSGIFGKVVSINDSDATIELEISDKVIVKYLKSSIVTIQDRANLSIDSASKKKNTKKSVSKALNSKKSKIKS